MIVYCVCLLVVLLDRASKISAYEYVQRPCSGGTFCGGHPNSLPFEPRYPSIRVGVAPGYPGDDSESCELPDIVDYGNNQQYPPVYPPVYPPPPCNDGNQLPVSVCVQLPPKTPLKLSKGILQQIIYSLTDGSNDVDPGVEPIIPIPLPTYPVPPYEQPQPPVTTTIPPPCTSTVPPPVQPVYPPQPYYAPPPPPPPQVYSDVSGYIQPGGPMIPASPPVTTTAAPPPPTTGYPGSPGGPIQPYTPPPPQTLPPPKGPAGSCYSCGSSMKPRYNLKR